MGKLHLILRYKGIQEGLVRKYECLFTVLKMVGKVAYKLELPLKLKTHLVFHVSMLKSNHKNPDDPKRGKSQRALVGTKVSYDKKIETILANQVVRQKNYKPRHEYLMH